MYVCVCRFAWREPAPPAKPHERAVGATKGQSVLSYLPTYLPTYLSTYIQAPKIVNAERRI